MPTVTSRSSVPSSGCQVRSRWSSSSWGRRRLTARIIIRTYSAMGWLKTPRALVTTRPRSGPGRSQDPLDPGRGGMDPGQARRPGQQPVERLGRQESTQEHLDVVERTVGQALDRDRHQAGARGGRPDPLEVPPPIARRQDRAEGDRRRDAAGTTTRAGSAPGAHLRPPSRGRASARAPRSPHRAAAPRARTTADRARAGRRPPRWRPRSARPSCTGRASCPSR